MAERAAERAAAPPSEAEARRDPTPDPLDPRKVSLDVFELYCRGMLATDLADVGTRCLLVEHLQVGAPRSRPSACRRVSTPRRSWLNVVKDSSKKERPKHPSLVCLTRFELYPFVTSVIAKTQRDAFGNN